MVFLDDFLFFFKLTKGYLLLKLITIKYIKIVND